MRSKLDKIALTAAFVLAIAFTFSCSDDKDGGDGGSPSGSSSSSAAEPVRKARIGGVSQKGPFVPGSTATLRELDGDFNQTGRSFSDIIADDHGKFDIRIGVELVSPYAMLEAEGFYRNEVTGKVSTASIKLYAIADIREKDNINVNLLTHLEYYRVLHLVENEGKTIADAKRQAQKEILAVFGIDSDGFINSEDMSIFGTGESDAALLAVSILLQGDLSEGPFSQRLTNFAQSLRTTGKWNNEAEKRAMANWASRDGYYCQNGNNIWWRETDDNKCWDHQFGSDIFGHPGEEAINNDVAFSAANIKSNILKWNLSSEVPDFEKYINLFYGTIYNFGVCSPQSQWSLKKSPLTPLVYVCKDSKWQWATERDIANAVNRDCSAANEGSVKRLGACYEEGVENGISCCSTYTCTNGMWTSSYWGNGTGGFVNTDIMNYQEYGCDFGF